MSENQESSSDSDSVSEADAVSADGSRYRTLVASKSGESDDDS